MNQSILSKHQIILIEESKRNYEKLIPQINELQKKYTIAELNEMCEKANLYYEQLIKSNYSQNLEQVIHQISYEFDKFREQLNINFEVNTTQEIPTIIKQSLKEMINYGWYPDFNGFSINGLIRFSKEVDELSKDEINDFFVDYYKNKIEAIKEKIFNIFPIRKDVLQAAFDAHEKENYLLAIPIFLIHIDGISLDTFKKYFFIKKKGTNYPEILDTIEKMNFLSEFSLSLLTPFQSEQPITYSEKQRGEDFKQFNRHQIMHGESLYYGTEINSYKAISLLLYIVQASDIIDRA